MRYAIVSDIHANRQAWEAAMNDIQGQRVDATVCLGDIVGYGPMPEAVLESVCDYVDDIVIGNHDAVIGGRSSSDLFGAHALKSLEWTRARLDESSIRFLGDLPSLIEGEGFALAHAEVLDPEMFGYIENPTDARLNFESNAYPLIFVGHTHCPEIYALDTTSHAIQRIPPQDFSIAPEHRYLVNVGSVGDPRDGSRESSYCIYDDAAGTIVFRRLLFDIDEYRRDMAERQVSYQPYFVMADAHPGMHPPSGDWAMEMPPRQTKTRKAPAKVFHVSRTDDALNQIQQEQAEAERLKRLHLATALKQARLEEDARRQAQAEAAREAMRKRQAAMERVRQEKEEEEHRLENEAKQRARERLQRAREWAEDRQKKQEVHAERLRQVLEERKVLAKQEAEAQHLKEGQEREERERRLLQRKRDLARAAEECRRKREAEREAAAADIRNKMKLKKDRATFGSADVSEVKDGTSAPEKPARLVSGPSTSADNLRKTREIVFPAKPKAKEDQGDSALSSSPLPKVDDAGKQVLEKAEPEDRRLALARLAAEKKRRRREADEARKQKAREAIRKKQEAARRQSEGSK